MRINTNLDSFHIMSLNDIYDAVHKTKKQIEELESLGMFICQKIKSCRDEFSSNNYERVQKATENFIKKLHASQFELLELVKSCEEIIEKIEAWER